jgi:hypothetical protein
MKNTDNKNAAADGSLFAMSLLPQPTLIPSRRIYHPPDGLAQAFRAVRAVALAKQLWYLTAPADVDGGDQATRDVSGADEVF